MQNKWKVGEGSHGAPGLWVVSAGPWQIVCSHGWLGRDQAATSTDGLYVAEETPGKTNPKLFPPTILLLGIVYKFNE